MNVLEDEHTKQPTRWKQTWLSWSSVILDVFTDSPIKATYCSILVKLNVELENDK
jgi:hypothetical protein